MPKIAFFGTPQIAVWVLEELAKQSIVPNIVVCNPDAPQGRKMVLTPPPAKVWAEAHGISVWQPESLKNSEAGSYLEASGCTLFIVAAYGKLIPKNILDIGTRGVLNVHPSLLPKFRGASPIRSAILNDVHETGVSIMLLDEFLDHGPILAQEPVQIEETAWPLRGQALDELLARQGGALLARVIPEWLAGHITPREQDHAAATFCTKITKDMGELDLHADSYQNLLKIRAFDGWPGTYFFSEKNGQKMRVKVTDAELAQDGSLKILRVIPEGKKEMSYDDFMRNV